MKDPTSNKIEDRRAQASEARAAMLAKMKERAKPAAPDPAFEQREERRKAELEAKRREHAARKEAERQTKVDAQQAVYQSLAEKEQTELEAKREARKERKKLEKDMARLKREERATGVRKPAQPEWPYA